MSWQRSDCRSCIFFEKADDGFGTCHRFPPSVHVLRSDLGTMVPASVWRPVRETDRCGEYDPGQDMTDV